MINVRNVIHLIFLLKMGDLSVKIAVIGGKRTMSEWTEQREVIQWFKSIYPQYEKSIRLSMSGLNLGGGIKAAKMINQMKAQGYVKGESDLFFAVPKGKYRGLFIEMKAIGKKPTPDQLEYLYYQVSMGYKAEWCEGAEAAIKVISDYMNQSGG